MTTKLTLTLDNKIILHAKQHAKEHHISLSKLVELFFKSLTEPSDNLVEKLPPVTKELSGIAKLESRKSDKELLIDALNKKYL